MSYVLSADTEVHLSNLSRDKHSSIDNTKQEVSSKVSPANIDIDDSTEKDPT